MFLLFSCFTSICRENNTFYIRGICSARLSWLSNYNIRNYTFKFGNVHKILDEMNWHNSVMFQYLRILFFILHRKTPSNGLCVAVFISFYFDLIFLFRYRKRHSSKKLKNKFAVQSKLFSSTLFRCSIYHCA